MQTEPVALILIVDDDLENLGVLSTLLTDSGFRVATANSGQDAWQKLGQITPDLILAAGMMSGVDGFELCRRIKTQPVLDKIPVILMIARNENQNRLAQVNLESVDYITKPFLPIEVLIRIRLNLRLLNLTRSLHESNTQLQQEIIARQTVEAKLYQLNQDLEQKVIERTQGLTLVLNEIQLREEKLTYEAFHDSLTGLFNRAWLMQYLSEIFAKQQPQIGQAILFLDLDHFKSVNDHLGHIVGDKLLQQVAKRLKNCIAVSHKIVRLSGDEFLIFLNNHDGIHSVEIIASAILQELHTPFEIDKYQISIGASIGILPSTLNYQQPTDILRDADAAMYQAKRAGKGCYIVFTNEMQLQTLKRIQLESELRQSIEKSEFCLYYQPILCLSSQKIVGLEALIQWQHPQRGLISPDKFITIAEESGIVPSLDLLALKLACQQLHQWQKKFKCAESLVIHINIAAAQLQHLDLVEKIQQILAEYHISPSAIRLEVTENALIKGSHTVTQVMDKIHNLGVKLCIDDFGTGYSCFSQLYTFPVDTLKIDRSFTKNVNVSVESAALVQTLINFANSLGITVVAEGIETQIQLEDLQKFGCEFGQGYLFSHPVPIAEITNFLQLQDG
ncbi:GGDEF/EAL domain-containing response regulator [Nostoc sp. CMAA1605]|uniref:GGDEF/EAL domain-containing response regulator n=1 Tax=Nostoc sp. CMAA1605 TaxID=2055159 RepID=UPI001F29C4A9|nr:EAL domain-containing protein [Nostoc sp. CMAA1605]MCF4968717.1 GGDEF domain-containing response regulator [Nostoc sp. CMAA1605]